MEAFIEMSNNAPTVFMIIFGLLWTVNVLMIAFEMFRKLRDIHNRTPTVVSYTEVMPADAGWEMIEILEGDEIIARFWINEEGEMVSVEDGEVEETA